MGYNVTTVSQSLTPTITAGAYSAGDVIGGLLTFDLASAGGGGIIEALLVADDDDEKAQLDFYLFNAAPTAIADNAAFAPLIADLKKLVYFKNIPSASYVTKNSNAYYLTTGINVPYAITSGNLYGYAVVVGTPTYTAVTDLTFMLTVRTD